MKSRTTGILAASTFALILTLLLLLAVMVASYFVAHDWIVKDYAFRTRNVVQSVCGRVINDARIYTLEPDRCEFWNSEFSTSIAITEDGYRQVSQVPVSATPAVAVLGDSHAFGWGVKDGSEFASLLASSQERPVINLAMSSYGTARGLLTFERLGKHSDVIIIQYCENDFRENIAFSEDPQHFLSSYQSRIESYNEVLTKVREHTNREHLRRRVLSYVYRKLVSVWQFFDLSPKTFRFEKIPSSRLEDEALTFAKVLSHFKDTLMNKRIIVFEINAHGAIRSEFASVFRSSTQAAGLQNVEFIDLSTVLTRSDFYFLDDHMNEQGHRKVAAVLSSVLGN